MVFRGKLGGNSLALFLRNTCRLAEETAGLFICARHACQSRPMLYQSFVQRLANAGLTVRTGEFAASMEVSLVNDGPVTVLVDSREGS